MKNILKKFILVVMLFGVMFTSSVVNAETAPGSEKFTSTTMSKTPVSFSSTFYVKKSVDGKYVYCVKFNKLRPQTSVNFTRGDKVTDAGMNYILEQGYKADNNNEYFVVQTALWVYLVDEGLMDNHSILTTFKNTLNSQKNSNTYAKNILNLINTAKNLKSYDQTKPSISLEDGTFNLKLSEDGKTYYYDSVKINSSESNYKVEFVNAPNGYNYSVKDGSIYVSVPASSVSESTSFTMKVSATKDIYTAYKYNPSSSKYQVMAEPFKETVSVNDEVKFNINYGKAVISKQDATTSSELPGASLVVKDSNGNVVESWISGVEPYEFTLAPGEYTLTETIAPEGYVLSNETVKFTIREDGSTTQVVMYNSPREKIVTQVAISKVDATNGKEIEGAHLVVKDSNGDVVDEWVSTTSVHMITGLKPGKYTLTETIAPEGYVLSNETITFTVKDDGTVTKVEMKNEPFKDIPSVEVEVPPTGSFKSVTSSLIGVIVLLIGSVLITKNVKKNEQ